MKRDAASLPASGGWCARCATLHTLPAEQAWQVCRELMAAFRRYRRIDWEVPQPLADPRCAIDSLFGAAGGKMFGVLCGRDAWGAPVTLRAFSGQLNGLWQAPGWVGPIFDVAALHHLSGAPEREIKRIGEEMRHLPEGTGRRRLLHAQRRSLSQKLMREIHALYRLVNFRGEELPLTEAFGGSGAPPSGTGDCCAPKLLHHAVTHGVRPVSLAEFYWGRSNASATRVHGRLYPPCAAKCQPILGFQLCGR